MHINKQIKNVGLFGLGAFVLICAIQFNLYRISKMGDIDDMAVAPTIANLDHSTEVAIAQIGTANK